MHGNDDMLKWDYRPFRGRSGWYMAITENMHLFVTGPIRGKRRACLMSGPKRKIVKQWEYPDPLDTMTAKRLALKDAEIYVQTVFVQYGNALRAMRGAPTDA